MQEWWRFWNYQKKYEEFLGACKVMTLQWRAVLKKRKYAAMEKSMIQIQSMVRAVNSYKNYKWRQARKLATEQAQRAWRNYRQYNVWYAAYRKLVHKGAIAELDEVPLPPASCHASGPARRQAARPLRFLPLAPSRPLHLGSVRACSP